MEKPAKKAGGLFGALKPDIAKKKKKKISPAELMREKIKAARPSPGKVVEAIKVPEAVEEEPEVVEREETTLENFTSFKRVVDDLLENLPPDILEAFSKSEDFEVYESVATAEDFTDEDQTFIRIVDDLLDKLPEEVIDEFTESADFELYEKVVEWGSD